MASPTNFGGWPTPIPFTRSSPPSAKAMMSPLAEKRWPRLSETGSPSSRERSRISVEPSVPADEHHGLGLDRAQRRVGFLGRREMDAPMAVHLLDVTDGQLGEDLSAMGLGVGKIGHRHGVLGADIAAGAAIAAKRAGRLLDACGIDGRLEADHDGRRNRLRAEAGARRFKRAIFGEVGGLCVAGRSQHGPRPGEALIEQAVFPHLARPGGIGKDARVRPQANRGIDQRAAAKPAADQHMNVGAEPEVEQAGAAAAPHLLANDLQLAAKLWQACRELAGQELAAALDDADAAGRRGRAARRRRRRHSLSRPRPRRRLA